MDKRQIIEQAARAAACDTAQAEKMAAALAAALCERCAALDTVAIPGFGSFVPEKHDEHIATDAATGKRTLMPPHIAVRFSPGSKLRKHLTANE